VTDKVLVLLVEDDDADAELIARALSKAMPGVEVEHAKTTLEYLERLAAGGFDAIVSDSSMPGCEGMTSFHFARERHPNVPFIFLSGTEDPRRDLRGLQSLGVSGVLTKSRLEELPPALQRSVQEARQRTPDASLVEGYERLVEAIKELSFARDLQAIMAVVRRSARALTGADGATFVLRRENMCYYADEDAIGPLWKGRQFGMLECISGWAMLNRQPAVVDDIRQDTRIPLADYEPTFVRSLVVVPIRAIDPIGAIGAYWSTERDVQRHEVKLLQALADSTAVAMDNVRAHEVLEARVRERTADLESFITAVSHDLHAPIRHAGAFASTIMGEQGATLAPEAKRQLQTVIDVVAHMGGMVEGLLELSRMSRAPVKRQLIDLAIMAREAAAACRTGAPREVDFVAPGSVPASGDRTLVRVVLQNLLDNAWKFSGKREAPRVEFGVQLRPDAEPVYFVRDNGAGFDEAQAHRLFGVFQRLHAPEDFPGTGVGLASVRRIIERHGGSIWATGAPGQGATFYFTLDRGRQLPRNEGD
jgi:signal transduction histidine kinase/DNA-binding NarL/FixJ family response regulator